MTIVSTALVYKALKAIFNIAIHEHKDTGQHIDLLGSDVLVTECRGLM
jgi:hypothetical protein